MTHTTEIIDYMKLNDSEYAVLIRCCEPCAHCMTPTEGSKCTCHLHWHTMHASVVNDESKHTASVEWARNLAAQNHEATIQAETKIKTLVGTKVEHS